MNIGTLWSKFFLRMHGKSIRNSGIDKTAWVHYGCNIANSAMGRHSYCGYDCWIINAEIASFCSIGANVRIGGASHPIAWVSTSPVFHSGDNVMKKHFSNHEFKVSEQTVIGNDVWIGDNSLIKAGVKISDGAVIGMGSMVTHDVGAYEIWAGNPARMIRKRFDDELADELVRSKWWEWSDEELSQKAKWITDPSEFLRRNEK